MAKILNIDENFLYCVGSSTIPQWNRWLIRINYLLVQLKHVTVTRSNDVAHQSWLRHLFADSWQWEDITVYFIIQSIFIVVSNHTAENY